MTNEYPSPHPQPHRLIQSEYYAPVPGSFDAEESRTALPGVSLPTVQIESRRVSSVDHPHSPGTMEDAKQYYSADLYNRSRHSTPSGARNHSSSRHKRPPSNASLSPSVASLPCNGTATTVSIPSLCALVRDGREREKALKEQCMQAAMTIQELVAEVEDLRRSRDASMTVVHPAILTSITKEPCQFCGQESENNEMKLPIVNDKDVPQVCDVGVMTVPCIEGQEMSCQTDTPPPQPLPSLPMPALSYVFTLDFECQTEDYPGNVPGPLNQSATKSDAEISDDVQALPSVEALPLSPAYADTSLDPNWVVSISASNQDTTLVQLPMPPVEQMSAVVGKLRDALTSANADMTRLQTELKSTQALSFKQGLEIIELQKLCRASRDGVAGVALLERCHRLASISGRSDASLTLLSRSEEEAEEDDNSHEILIKDIRGVKPKIAASKAQLLDMQEKLVDANHRLEETVLELHGSREREQFLRSRIEELKCASESVVDATESRSISLQTECVQMEERASEAETSFIQDSAMQANLYLNNALLKESLSHLLSENAVQSAIYELNLERIDEKQNQKLSVQIACTQTVALYNSSVNCQTHVISTEEKCVATDIIGLADGISQTDSATLDSADLMCESIIQASLLELCFEKSHSSYLVAVSDWKKLQASNEEEKLNYSALNDSYLQLQMQMLDLRQALDDVSMAYAHVSLKSSVFMVDSEVQTKDENQDAQSFVSSSGKRTSSRIITPLPAPRSFGYLADPSSEETLDLSDGGAEDIAVVSFASIGAIEPHPDIRDSVYSSQWQDDFLGLLKQQQTWIEERDLMERGMTALHTELELAYSKISQLEPYCMNETEIMNLAQEEGGDWQDIETMQKALRVSIIHRKELEDLLTQSTYLLSHKDQEIQNFESRMMELQHIFQQVTTLPLTREDREDLKVLWGKEGGEDLHRLLPALMYPFYHDHLGQELLDDGESIYGESVKSVNVPQQPSNQASSHPEVISEMDQVPYDLNAGESTNQDVGNNFTTSRRSTIRSREFNRPLPNPPNSKSALASSSLTQKIRCGLACFPRARKHHESSPPSLEH